MLALAAPLLATTTAVCAAQTQWEAQKTWHLGGEGSWDYVSVEPSTHRIFLTRSTHTEIVDERTGKVLGDIPGQVRSHGVALAPKLNRGFITDGGGSGAIVIFDLTTYEVIGKLAALPDADGILYDGQLNRVLAVSGDGNALLTFPADISPQGKIDPPIALGGAPEFLASDGSGKVYVNLEDKNLVAEVDLGSRKVLARWPIGPAGHPVGMAIDTARHRIFVGCRNPAALLEMSTTDGHILGSVPIPAGNDAVGFMDGQVFASTHDGTLVVAGDVAGHFAVEQQVKTEVGARTLGLDPAAKKVFLPTAEFETAGSATPNARPKVKPETFMLIVVGAKR